MATSVAEWKRAEEMTLPSGNVAKLRRVGLIDLIAQGGIPDTLGALAAEVASQQRTRAMTIEELARYEGIVNLVVKAAMVEPKVGDESGPDMLGVREIDFIDRIEIFKWANGAATVLRPFRREGQKRTFNAS